MTAFKITKPISAFPKILSLINIYIQQRQKGLKRNPIDNAADSAHNKKKNTGAFAYFSNAFSHTKTTPHSDF